jgi:hypothetical protein
VWAPDSLSSSSVPAPIFFPAAAESLVWSLFPLPRSPASFAVTSSLGLDLWSSFLFLRHLPLLDSLRAQAFLRICGCPYVVSATFFYCAVGVLASSLHVCLISVLMPLITANCCLFAKTFFFRKRSQFDIASCFEFLRQVCWWDFVFQSRVWFSISVLILLSVTRFSSQDLVLASIFGLAITLRFPFAARAGRSSGLLQRPELWSLFVLWSDA